MSIKESDTEEVALDYFRELGYQVLHGPDISPAPDVQNPERKSYSDVHLFDRLTQSLEKINPTLSKEAISEAVKRVLRQEHANLLLNNESFHKLLVEGIQVQVKRKDGSTHWETVKLFDFENLENNDWAVVNQFSVQEGREIARRPDIVVFVNGLPLGLVELKNPTDEKATIWSAFDQFDTYKQGIPSIFRFNEVLVVSDGLLARHGTISSGKEWFLPWKTINGEVVSKGMPQMEVLIKGIFRKDHFLDLIRNFVVYETTKKGTIKKMAAYHQYNAVNKAVNATHKASNVKGDKRCGVVWHTTGAGKSLSMAFYTGKLAQSKELENPTIVVLTDRNDLDDQLFETFTRCQSLLRQEPKQAQDRKSLRGLLKTASGGIIFTTIQKFSPDKEDPKPSLSDRRNIIVIADEAHRSQYDFIDGFARHIHDALPNASFIGFTGTPIEKADKSTKAVFGEYIDTYDVHQAVEDGATVRISYEPRLAKISLKAEEKPKIDQQFELVTEKDETEHREKTKSQWSKVEKLVGSEKRLALVAQDLVNHFEQRLETLDGKAMVVCMSRRICVDLYTEIIKLRPKWHNSDDEKGFIKIIMTGSATDPASWQQHIRNKGKRRTIGDNFKDSKHPLKMVIVRDMWLTGFDVPSMHTMYVDKPMSGHGLIQAINRVNRVFKDKPGGLVVDYLGIADNLKKALAEYSPSSRKDVGVPKEESVAVMIEKYEIAKNLFHGFNIQKFFNGTKKERLDTLFSAVDYIAGQQDGNKRFTRAVVELSKAFALSAPHEEADKIRDDVAFFQAVKASIVKITTQDDVQTQEQTETAIRQIISSAIVPDKVIDIYKAAGIKTPDISILSDQFLAEIREMPLKNLAMELLRKLLNDEIKIRSKKNLVQSRSFADMLEQAVKRYQNQNLQTAEVIEKLIEIAKQMKEAQKRGQNLGLNDDEVAFYDALETNDSAVKVLGDTALLAIAREVADTVRNNRTIDWTIKESVQANLRRLVKRVLRKYGYPPDKQEKAVQTVMQQATLMAENMEEAS